MLRVLSPAELMFLDEDAQAIICAYCNHKWLSPRLLEELITSVVTISRMRQVPADKELVDAVFRSLGESDRDIAMPSGLMGSDIFQMSDPEFKEHLS